MRDPKAMAQTLRDDLATKAIKITHGESLEILSHVFGFADWNTMSAVTREKLLSDKNAAAPTTYPAMPVRDATIFPVDQFSLWLKRGKTLRALDEAFRVKRQIVIVTQKSPGTDDPGADDIYAVGVLARVIDIRPPTDAAGSTEVLIQPLRRVRILSFEGADGAYRAKVQEPDEGPIVTAPDLIKSAASAFAKHAASQGITIPPQLQAKSALGDAGHFADLITVHSRIPTAQKQGLLEIFEPILRLKQVIALLEAN